LKNSGGLSAIGAELIIIFFVSALFTAKMFAQTDKNIIEGKIFDKSTGKPLALVNVYLSQTTLGAATDNNGYFKIENVPTASFILVASMIGFESNALGVDVKKNSGKFVEVFLVPTTYEMKEVSVKDEEDTDWKRKLELFKKYFFGANEFTEDCEFINPYHINFIEDENKFVAETSLPIIIKNKALGYEIESVLKYFQINKRSRETAFLIYPKFKELISSNKDSLEIFKENRRKAYLGSTQHLFFSLAADEYKFRDEGFELRQKSELVNKASEIVKHDSKTNEYYLHFDGCLTIKFWIPGKQTSSVICLKYGEAQFSPEGYLMYPGEFSIEGNMASEGMATMLPRFAEFNTEYK
jgi:hypothetical protein